MCVRIATWQAPLQLMMHITFPYTRKDSFDQQVPSGVVGGGGQGRCRHEFWRLDEFSWLTRTPRVDTKVNSEPDPSPKAASVSPP